jgi:hypothetical protein
MLSDDYAWDKTITTIRNLKTDIAAAKAERDEAIEVLRNIADPMEYLKSYAKELGHEINVEYAIKFSNSSECLRGLARAFLARMEVGK